jgi:short-subunit dehydrogenase
MDHQLSGSVAVVTGASRGIGRAIASALRAQGVTVVGVAREVGTVPGGFACDLREPGSAERVVQHVLDSHGRLDIVVANAGVGYAGDLAAMTDDRLAALVELNVTAPLQLARAALPVLRARGSGRLLFVTSIAGALGVPGESAYSASKAAVEMFADVLREEVRGDGITVGTLLPGVVQTDFFEQRGQPFDRKFPRPMPPDRVARAAVRLLVSGGRSAVCPRWLAFPIRLRSMAPGLYRRLERRFG